MNFKAEGGVLYDEATGTMCVLSPAATVVWCCFDGDATLGEIAADVSDAYGTGLAGVLDELHALARALAENGMLEGPPA